MVFINHTQTSQGFSGGLSVGVWEAKASGGDEPGFHVGLATGTRNPKPDEFLLYYGTGLGQILDPRVC